MSLQIRNSKELINPGKFYWKVLLIGNPGVGKTEWMGTCPNIGIAAGDTGQGRGILTIASKGVEFVEPSNLPELESFCGGQVFKDKQALGLDGLSNVARSIIKDAALALRIGGTTKRQQGIPELDDYGAIAEMTRRLLAKLLDQPKHIIVTATEKYLDPPENLIIPDLPGSMALGSTAMFDTILRLKTRQVLRDPKDPKSRYVERYFITQPDGQGTIAKCRNTITGKQLLDPEEIFDLSDGRGTFGYLLEKILNGYKESTNQTSAKAV